MVMNHHQKESCDARPRKNTVALISYLSLILCFGNQAQAFTGAVYISQDGPVHVMGCKVSSDYDDEVTIKAPFKNESTMTATDVSFHFVFADAFHNIIDEENGMVHGEFSPGSYIDANANRVHLDPQSGSLTADPLFAPLSPFWNFYAIKTESLDTVICSITAVKLEDGSIWQLEK
jgi:hypothetical protein